MAFGLNMNPFPIAGYVVSSPSGDYDTDVLLPRKRAELIARSLNDELDAADDGGGRWAVGVVFKDGTVLFTA